MMKSNILHNNKLFYRYISHPFWKNIDIVFTFHQHQLYSKTFDVGINRSMNFVWKLRNGREEYSTHQLTELIVKELIERAYYS